MIIVRSPLRITLGGGGTDLPSYYREFGGSLIAAAIDIYVYITLHENFAEDLIVKYSKLERVPEARHLAHPIIREAMSLLSMNGKGLEVTSMADIPAGTGLGSSGSFTTALLKALHTHNRHLIQPQQLAEQACHIEIDRLGEPVGKQDQYISAYGGLTCFEFYRDDSVKAWPLRISPETRYNLEDSLVLFFTGYSRSASSILADQQARTSGKDKSMIESLHFIKELGERSKLAIEHGNLKEFGQLMNEHWEHKRRRSKGMSNPQIDACYELALRNGAIGGKLIGAGGGGFLMFYTEDKIHLRHILREKGLTEVRFRFDFEGTKVVV
jgi:D-glycero-alpha-D-manno-heptose-7-phosphate kinase